MKVSTQEKIVAYFLQASEDGANKILCFTTKEDAQRFKNFSNMYMEESGAGNGYGAYWVMRNADIIGVTKTVDIFTFELQNHLLEHMRESIAIARTAGESTGDDINFSVSNTGRAISFQIDNFPERQRPSKGDMFRNLYSYAGAKIEGRVIEDNDDTLKVISCLDEDDDGKPNPSATFIDISSSDVMKINDWKDKHRKEK